MGYINFTDGKAVSRVQFYKYLGVQVQVFEECIIDAFIASTGLDL